MEARSEPDLRLIIPFAKVRVGFRGKSKERLCKVDKAPVRLALDSSCLGRQAWCPTKIILVLMP